MPKIETCELPGFSNNIKLKEINKQYNTYNTIRRDLRDAHKIFEYTISLQKSLLEDSNKLSEDQDTFLVKASILHAIILYSRWFKSTKGKLTLSYRDFFKENTEEESTHEKLIELRDSYIAHNELDLLGIDKTFVNTDDSNKFISSSNEYFINIIPSIEKLKAFKKCVEIIHNKIDGTNLPEVQKNLDTELKAHLNSHHKCNTQ